MDSSIEHVVPRWFLRFIQTAALSLLLIADMYLIGTMMVDGWVRNANDVGGWLSFQGAGVPIFFLSGVALGGLGILASSASALSFAHGKRVRGFLLLLGGFTFMLIEIWASISERSQNVPLTKADTWLLTTIGAPNAVISPTLIAIAVALPLGSFLFGFIQIKPQEKHESVDAMRDRQQRELLTIQFKQEKAKMRTTGFVNLGKAALNTARGIEETPEEPAADDDATTTETPDETAGKPTAKSAGLPPGMIGKDGLMAWSITDELVRALTDTDATEILKIAKGSQRLSSAQGQPYIANAASAKSLARRRYPVEMIRLVDDRKGRKPTAFAPHIRRDTDDGAQANG